MRSDECCSLEMIGSSLVPFLASVEGSGEIFTEGDNSAEPHKLYYEPPRKYTACEARWGSQDIPTGS